MANTIAEFEPVNMLVRKADLPVAKRLVGKSVKLITTALDDLWIRDTGPVFVTKQQLTILRSATDAAGRRLKVHVLRAPSRVRSQFDSDDFAAGYIGFYACNGAVISQHFGDRQADRTAKATQQEPKA